MALKRRAAVLRRPRAELAPAPLPRGGGWPLGFNEAARVHYACDRSRDFLAAGRTLAASGDTGRRIRRPNIFANSRSLSVALISPSPSAPYKPASGFNGRPHRLVPRRGELDCRMLLFTSDLDPTIIAYAAQHQFTRWNGKASGDLPIVEA